jgi:hypothetical protein
MDFNTFLAIITVLAAVFLFSLLYLGNTVSTQQLRELKATNTTEFTSRQKLAITAAQITLYGSVGLSAYVVGEGLAQWLAN